MKTKIIVLFLMFATTVFSQNITNTLGSNGLFTIKDVSNNYLTLSQSTGQLNLLRSLRLENTTSSNLGIIFKGNDRFIHNYYMPGTNASNTFIGINSGNFTMSGSGNASSFNTGVGENSLYSLTTGHSNTSVGNNALFFNSQGLANTGIGTQSLYQNSTGNFNTSLGTQSMYTNTTGYENTAVGMYSMRGNTIGHYNTAVGNQSLFNNTTGNENTALGNQSLYLNSSGTFNTAIGFQSLYSNQDGFGNTALGYQSLFSNTSGAVNLAIGFLSLHDNTGSLNTAIGNYAGSLVTTGSNLTLIGYGAQSTSGSATNQITLGNSDVTSLRCNVTTISSLSDARDKKNISDLSLGIDFLMKIKPRLFNWDKREWYENNIPDGSKMKETPTAGFIAQELDEVQTTENADWLNLVLKDNPEKLEATYGNLLPVMVKAIQELNVESEKLKVENIELKNENKEMKQNNQKLSSEVELLKSMNEKIVKLEHLVNELTSVKNTSLLQRNK